MRSTSDVDEKGRLRMRSKAAKRRGFYPPALTLAAALAIASPSAAGIWDGCKAIPKYPNAQVSQYCCYPETGLTEKDIIREHTSDSPGAIITWYIKNLPGWTFSDHTKEYPPSWELKKPDSNLGVSILDGAPMIIQFECN
jgi:hypothetical protein